jgi:TonB family protein
MILCAGVVTLALGCACAAWGQTVDEYQVKAAYLLNFAKLAEWPRQSLSEGPRELVIGVFGRQDEFFDALKKTVTGKRVGTHPIAVRQVGSDDDMRSCQIVFFHAAEPKRTAAAIAGLAQSGILLVGEDGSFLQAGGMINLVMEDGKIRFELNNDALDRSEIHFSARILMLAKASPDRQHPVATNLQSESLRQIRHSISPQYPEIAQRMNLKGAVQLEATVRPDGTVKEVKVLGGHPLLADAVVRAVMQWTYQPGTKETIEVVKFSFNQ